MVAMVAFVRAEKRANHNSIQNVGAYENRRIGPPRPSINWKHNLRVQKQRGREPTCQAHTTRIPRAGALTHTCSPRRIIQIMTPMQRTACKHSERRARNSQFAPRDEPLHADIFIRDTVKCALQWPRLSRRDPSPIF